MLLQGFVSSRSSLGLGRFGLFSGEMRHRSYGLFSVATHGETFLGVGGLWVPLSTEGLRGGWLAVVGQVWQQGVQELQRNGVIQPLSALCVLVFVLWLILPEGFMTRYVLEL